MANAGRPSKYDEKYCQELIDHMSAGYHCELFLPIHGFPNHRVSNLGKIQTRQIRGSCRTGDWVDIKQRQNKRDGYFYLTIAFQKKRRTAKIHRFVAETFLRKIEDRHHVNHIDGDKTNNSAENLEWCSPKENTIHAHRKGLIVRKGSKNSQAKLTEQDVFQIKQLLSSGKRNRELSNLFGVAPNTISQIRTGYRWAHV